ncbi:MAG: hypothetical protein LAT84_01025 [Balneolia bacterium]|nr:hypothetical protein [Balneolia bacterium]
MIGLFAMFSIFGTSSSFDSIAQSNDAADEVDVHDIILLEIQRLRVEINELSETQLIELDDKTAVLNDRLAALDRRLLTIEGRVNSVFGEFSTFEMNLAVAIGVMVAIALITVITLLILRRKTIDPVHVQIAALKTAIEQNTPGADKDVNKLRLALTDLAKDDPYLSQILKRHGLI